ncbi:MAG: hypothetical protein EHM14_04865 [Methanothrix sp.]|nr:MAG: hypothetical protein EHM14_04865 [Methanothrix sp.]
MRLKRLTLPILVFALVLASNAGGIMYLFSGTDSYGLGMSYPGINRTPAVASFVINDSTSQLASVFLAATIMRPEFRQIKYHNRSENYPLVESFRNNSFWSQYSFYLPTISSGGWSPASHTWLAAENEDQVASIKDFTSSNWKPAEADYQTPSVREFAREENYRMGLEAHNDAKWDSQNHFLDDDEPPRPPLL